MTVTAVEALQIWMQSKQTFQDFGLALAPSLSTLDFLLINKIWQRPKHTSLCNSEYFFFVKKCTLFALALYVSFF